MCVDVYGLGLGSAGDCSGHSVGTRLGRFSGVEHGSVSPGESQVPTKYTQTLQTKHVELCFAWKIVIQLELVCFPGGDI